MFNFFKKKKTADPPAEAPAEETSAIQETKAPVSVKTPTKTVIKRDAPKKTYGKEESAKKTSVKKEPAKKTPARKEPVKKTSVKKEPAKKAPAKKTAKASVPEVVIPGTMPKELKGFEKELKNYASHSRMPYDKDTANMVFTEYMAKAFRELGYKMVLIRDQENGIITMLDRDREGDSGDSIKSKLVVKCVFLKKGSAGSDLVRSAYEAGESNRADEIWCVTTTDFDANAVRRSKKKDATVNLYDGRRLYSEFLSKDER